MLQPNWVLILPLIMSSYTSNWLVILKTGNTPRVFSNNKLSFSQLENNLPRNVQLTPDELVLHFEDKQPRTSHR
jgi:hypothetical protein